MDRRAGVDIADRERRRLQSRRQRDQAATVADAFGNSVQGIVFTDETRDKLRRRFVIEAMRRSNLNNGPMIEYRHAIGHRQGFALVVGHTDHRDSQHLVDLLQLDLHVLAQLLVERAKRFIHQNERWLEDQSARQRDALLLPA